MSGLAHRRVMVAGAGVVGSSIALVLARAGADVLLVDPAPLGDNASGVAAGMLAPAFEAILDPVAASHFALLRAARDRWPAFADLLGPEHIGLRRSGGLWLASPADPDSLIESRRTALEALGVAVDVVSPAQAQGLASGLCADIGPGLFVGEDWRLDPLRSLTRLRAAAIRAGVTVVAGRLLGFDDGVGRLADGRTLAADRLVVATGAETVDLAPELAVLAPIKGHILRFPEIVAREGEPATRWSGGYALGGPAGLVIGATMEPGRSDRRIDEPTVRRLHGLATEFYPMLAGARPLAQAGVRASTPDGLPLVGPSLRADVFLAVGVRRNGWLLAPLIAEIAAACFAGRDLGPFAARLDASRFAVA